MNFESFWSDVAATIIGGVALAILFFLAKEKFLPLPKLSGCWYFEQATTNTAYKPYTGMVLRYVVMLCQEGNRVEGTAEKIYENSSTGKREFVGANRTRAIVSGYVEKKYLGKDKVYLHVVEDGHGRESTHFYDLTLMNADTMAGTFTSMVADQTGSAKCQRTSF